MESINNIAGRVFTTLAEKTFPAGSVIRCLKCNVKRNCTTGEIAGWMKSGFPYCKKCNSKTQLDNPWIGASCVKT